MYKLPKEQRDLLISQMPLPELQSLLIAYVDKDAADHEGHCKRMKKYNSKKRLREEEAKIIFKCDWETVKQHWIIGCKANTVKTYRTAHQYFMEKAISMRPIEPCPHTAFINLLNSPNRIREYVEATTCALSTKICKVKYLLALIEQYPGIDKHVQAFAVDKLQTFYQSLLLQEIEQNNANEAVVPKEEQITYTDLLERCRDVFGPMSTEYIFVRTMLEIPCRGDLATMQVYTDEDIAKQHGAENYIILPVDEEKCASYNLHNFKTMSFCSRYTTSDDLSMELTAIFRQRLKSIMATDEQPYSLFPISSHRLTKLIKSIKDGLNVPLSIAILRHMLQRHAKSTMSQEDYVSFNRKMLHGIKVGEEVYLK